MALFIVISVKILEKPNSAKISEAISEFQTMETDE